MIVTSRTYRGAAGRVNGNWGKDHKMLGILSDRTATDREAERDGRERLRALDRDSARFRFGSRGEDVQNGGVGGIRDAAGRE
jgi:hypothetical protein